jgi:hypothetical protein
VKIGIELGRTIDVDVVVLLSQPDYWQEHIEAVYKRAKRPQSKSPVLTRSEHHNATNVVVVGDLIGSGEAQERGIVGETPNLAARLQGIAEPSAVLIADGTRRLLGNL